MALNLTQLGVTSGVLSGVAAGRQAAYERALNAASVLRQQKEFEEEQATERYKAQQGLYGSFYRGAAGAGIRANAQLDETKFKAGNTDDNTSMTQYQNFLKERPDADPTTVAQMIAAQNPNAKNFAAWATGGAAPAAPDMSASPMPSLPAGAVPGLPGGMGDPTSGAAALGMGAAPADQSVPAPVPATPPAEPVAQAQSQAMPMTQGTPSSAPAGPPQASAGPAALTPATMGRSMGQQTIDMSLQRANVAAANTLVLHLPDTAAAIANQRDPAVKQQMIATLNTQAQRVGLPSLLDPQSALSQSPQALLQMATGHLANVRANLAPALAQSLERLQSQVGAAAGTTAAARMVDAQTGRIEMPSVIQRNQGAAAESSADANLKTAQIGFTAQRLNIDARKLAATMSDAKMAKAVSLYAQAAARKEADLLAPIGGTDGFATAQDKAQAIAGEDANLNTYGPMIQGAVGNAPSAAPAPAAIQPLVKAATDIVGKDCGPNGCARALMMAAKDAGMPVPQTPNASLFERQLTNPRFGWKVVSGTPQVGDIVGMAGDGPSGRHVGIVTQPGMMVNDPGKRSGNKAMLDPVPAGVTVYRYTGAAPPAAQAAPPPKQVTQALPPVARHNGKLYTLHADGKYYSR